MVWGAVSIDVRRRPTLVLDATHAPVARHRWTTSTGARQPRQLASAPRCMPLALTRRPKSPSSTFLARTCIRARSYARSFNTSLTPILTATRRAGRENRGVPFRGRRAQAVGWTSTTPPVGERAVSRTSTGFMDASTSTSRVSVASHGCPERDPSRPGQEERGPPTATGVACQVCAPVNPIASSAVATAR